MSIQLTCDYEECQTIGYGGGTQVVIAEETFDFCKPEHAVLWFFQQYPDMPLWYGPKTVSPRPDAELVEAINAHSTFNKFGGEYPLAYGLFKDAVEYDDAHS